MIGDVADIRARLKRLMPAWFGADQGETPVLDGALTGPGAALAHVHELYAYAKLQTRIATLTGGWLDLCALDFFGGDLKREGRSDAAFRTAIVAELFRPKATREAIRQALLALTGREPKIFEPRRAADTGAYNVGFCGYNVAGGWGSHELPAQVFVEVERPRPSGTPGVSGYNEPYGGYNTASPLEWRGNIDEAAVTDGAIYTMLDRVKPAGVTIWTRIVAAFEQPGETPEPPSLPFPASWTHRAPIVIQESRITGASVLTDFPVLLTEACLPAAFLDSDLFQADGGDIRFTSDEAGLQDLACEIVSFAGNSSSASATCEIWVKAPSVAPSTNTTFYVWRRSGAGITQPAVDAPSGRNAVWSDYLCVFHGDDLSDATGNGNDLTAFGGATVGASLARIGRAFSLERASSQYLSAGSASMLDNLAAATVQCWMRTTLASAPNQFPMVISKSLATVNGPTQLFLDDDITRIGWQPPGGNFVEPDGQAALNVWAMVSGGYGGTGAGSARLMRDGATLELFDRGTGPPDDDTGDFVIGWIDTTDPEVDHFNGQIDEVRLRGEFMSTDWMQADYETQANPALFSIPGAVTAL